MATVRPRLELVPSTARIGGLLFPGRAPTRVDGEPWPRWRHLTNGFQLPAILATQPLFRCFRTRAAIVECSRFFNKKRILSSICFYHDYVIVFFLIIFKARVGTCVCGAKGRCAPRLCRKGLLTFSTLIATRTLSIPAVEHCTDQDK